MFGFLKKKTAQLILAGIRDKFMNPGLEGIAVIKSFSWQGKKLYLNIVLTGLEDREIIASCENVSINPDGSSVSLSGFASDMPFVENALNRFAARTYPVPEGSVRLALVALKNALGM